MATEGKDTSEYALAKDVSLWANIISVLGMILGGVSTMIPDGSIWGVVVGGLVAALSQVAKALSAGKYAHSRAIVKMNPPDPPDGD